MDRLRLMTGHLLDEEVAFNWTDITQQFDSCVKGEKNNKNVFFIYILIIK